VLNYLFFSAKLTTFKRNVTRKYNISDAIKSLILKKDTEDAVLKNIKMKLKYNCVVEQRESDALSDSAT
jgi:hypothetical protein